MCCCECVDRLPAFWHDSLCFLPVLLSGGTTDSEPRGEDGTSYESSGDGEEEKERRTCRARRREIRPWKKNRQRRIVELKDHRNWRSPETRSEDGMGGERRECVARANEFIIEEEKTGWCCGVRQC